MRGFFKALLIALFIIWKIGLLTSFSGMWPQGIMRACGGTPRAKSMVGGSDAALCRIKGNISISGERIYHMPGDCYSAATRIDPVTGERWFCSEGEARAVGWRLARTVTQLPLPLVLLAGRGGAGKMIRIIKKFSKNSIALIWIKAKIDKAS